MTSWFDLPLEIRGKIHRYLDHVAINRLAYAMPSPLPYVSIESTGQNHVHRIYCVNGVPHRNDGPAIASFRRSSAGPLDSRVLWLTLEYLQHGQLHREGGLPARIRIGPIPADSACSLAPTWRPAHMKISAWRHGASAALHRVFATEYSRVTEICQDATSTMYRVPTSRAREGPSPNPVVYEEVMRWCRQALCELRTYL